MKLRSLRQEGQPKLMIIPMIDIMFFLLVFFMLSTLYMVEQRIFPVSLPQAVTAKLDMQKQIPITIAADGRIWLEQEEIPRPLLGERVKVEIGRNPETLFILRADKKAEYGEVVSVLDELKHHGVKRVSVATEAKPGTIEKAPDRT